MAVKLEAKDGILHVVGDKPYKLGADGLSTIVDPGETATVLAGKDSARLLNEALLHVEENASSLSAEVKEALHGSIDHFTGVEPERLKRIKDALTAAKELESAANVDAAKAIVTKNPLAANYLREAGEKHLGAMNFDLKAVQAEIKAAADKVAKIAGLNTDLTKLMTEKPDAAAVKQFIKTNQAHLADLEPEAAAIAKLKLATNYDFAAAKVEIFKAVEVQTARAEVLLKDLIVTRDVIASKPGAEALKKATEDAGKIEKELGEIMKHEYAGVIKSKLPEDLAKEVAKVHPEMAAKIGSTAAANTAKGARWVTGGKWNSFMHDAESAGAEVAKIGKIRWGKAAVVGVPLAGLVAYFAGAGNKGPGERAEAVSKGRDGQAAGASVA